MWWLSYGINDRDFYFSSCGSANTHIHGCLFWQSSTLSPYWLEERFFRFSLKMTFLCHLVAGRTLMQKNDASHLALRSVDTTYKIITRTEAIFLFFWFDVKKRKKLGGNFGIFFLEWKKIPEKKLQNFFSGIFFLKIFFSWKFFSEQGGVQTDWFSLQTRRRPNRLIQSPDTSSSWNSVLFTFVFAEWLWQKESWRLWFSHHGAAA